MKTNSIRFKTTVLYSCILGFILVCFSVFIFHSVRTILNRNADDELKLKAAQFVATINAYGEISNGQLPGTSLLRDFLSINGDGLSPGKEAIDRLWDRHRWLLGAHNDIFLITDINGKVMMQSDNLPAGVWGQIEKIGVARAKNIEFHNLKADKAFFRGISFPFTFASRKPYVLYMALPTDTVNRVLSQLIEVILIGIGSVLFLTLFIGSFLTRKILTPVREVTLTANNISQKNLGLRITTQARDEEMRLLVDSFNQMIDRLEHSFTHINEFSSHAAHELKTPLAIIKGELELALSAVNSREEDHRVMQVSLQEVNRLIKITKDLLLLAKFEYNLNIFKMERFDLAPFLADIYQHSTLLAAEKDIALELSSNPADPVWVKADATHLRRLFFNLVHNAVKFTSSGGKISIALSLAGSQAQVDVQDTGEGISAADQLKIFDKFFTSARHVRAETAGNGLGLCMARSIARAHGGDIRVSSEPGKGSVFTVTLPLAAS